MLVVVARREGGHILNTVVREGLAEKVTFEPDLK